ncbi:MAG: protein kinase [Reyranellaceae bacterium]
MTSRIEHRAALPVGYGLHEYRITGVLGHGGFGITYSAHDAGLGKTVAIKEYLPGEFAVRDGGIEVAAKSSEDSDPFHWGLERFLDEARILARFHHPNVVGVHRYFEANGTAYMVMEFVDGDTLAQTFRNGRTFDAAGLMELAQPLLDGLEAVHRAGYLHRDIKPSNIMLRADGRPVLLDFGSARSALGRGSRTVTSIVTPGYAPYEQYYCDGNQGPWTDIYALGAILHQIVAGRPPVEAPARLKNDPLPKAATLGKGRYPPAMLAAIDWALAFDETQRPQCVADWRQALLGRTVVPAAVSLPLAVQAAERLGRAAGQRRRPARRGLVLAVLLAGLLSVSGLSYGVYEYRQLEVEQARELAFREQTRQEVERAADLHSAALAQEIEARQDAERKRQADQAAAERARLAEEQRRIEEAARAERERQAEIVRARKEAEERARRATDEAEARRRQALEAERRALEQARLEEAERRAREEQARRNRAASQGPVFGRTVTRDQLGRPRILTGPINPDAQPQPQPQGDMRWDDINRDVERDRGRERRYPDQGSWLDLRNGGDLLSFVSLFVASTQRLLAQQDAAPRLQTDPDAAAERQRRAEQRARERAEQERLQRDLQERRERQQEQLRLLENERLRERR